MDWFLLYIRIDRYQNGKNKLKVGIKRALAESFSLWLKCIYEGS